MRSILTVIHIVMEIPVINTPDQFHEVKIYQHQNEELQKKLNCKTTECTDLHNLMKPVCEEYDEMRTKYEIESSCRQEAETFATKLSKENKVLRRQSQAFFGKTGGEISPEEETSVEREYRQKKEETIKELQAEVAQLRSRIRSQQHEIEIEKQKAEFANTHLEVAKKELENTKKALEERDSVLAHLSHMSVDALSNYDSLWQKLEIEAECRNQAEIYASKMHSQNQGMKRQSNVLMCQITSDEKLSRAMLEIETMSADLASHKLSHKQEVIELREELKALKSTETMNTLKGDIEKFMAENETLQKQIINCQLQHKELQTNYEELQKKYTDVTAPPPPPPPPPLPPVFNTVPKKKRMIDIIKERNKKLFPEAKAGTKTNDYEHAIKEMMSRIKSGKPFLKPAASNQRRPSCPEPGDGAINELQNIMGRMSRTRSESDVFALREVENEDVKSVQDTQNKISVSDLSRRFEKAKTPPPVQHTGGRARILSDVQEDRENDRSSVNLRNTSHAESTCL